MAFNNIYPGFPWTQVFRFDGDAFPVGASVRADFRKNLVAPVLLSISEGLGVTRMGNDFALNLSGAQTALLAPAGEFVMFDFVRTPDQTHLGLRVTVPITPSIAAPV